MRKLRIEPKGEKGRSFGAYMLAHVVSNLWEGSSGGGANTIRPCWMMLAGHPEELRMFATNLQQGHRAEEDGSFRGRGTKRFEVLRSANYALSWQRFDEGHVATFYLPSLFRVDPGMVDPVGASFVILPSREWLKPAPKQPPAAYAKFFREERSDWDEVAPLAPLLVQYLDRRTRCPILPDPAFHYELLAESLLRQLAFCNARSNVVQEEGTTKVGFGPCLGFKASHLAIESLLADTTQAYLSRSRRRAA